MKIFLYFEDILSYHFLYKNLFFLQIQKYHFSFSDQKNFSFVKSSTFVDYFAINFSKINGFNKNDMVIWTWPCFHSIKICYFSLKILREIKKYFFWYSDQCSTQVLLMNVDNLFQNFFWKIIYGTGSFHKWKIFLIWVGEVIFLDLSKKVWFLYQKW